MFFNDILGKTAWSKLLDIFFHIMFECADGRSDQFYQWIYVNDRNAVRDNNCNVKKVFVAANEIFIFMEAAMYNLIQI